MLLIAVDQLFVTSIIHKMVKVEMYKEPSRAGYTYVCIYNKTAS